MYKIISIAVVALIIIFFAYLLISYYPGAFFAPISRIRCIPSEEICNGLDDDCDGEIDDGIPCETHELCSGDACITVYDIGYYQCSDNIDCSVSTQFSVTGENFTCGDVNCDGQVNIADVVYLINYLFISGPEPCVVEAGDTNGDGVINVADIVYLTNYLFINGPEPLCNKKNAEMIIKTTRSIYKAGEQIRLT